MTTRIHFPTTHADALRRELLPHVGRFKLPFRESAAALFTAATGIELFADRNEPEGVWRSVQSEEEYRRIAEWVRSQGGRVFLRPPEPLRCCFALDFNLRGPGEEYTETGGLENRAKHGRDASAIRQLTERVAAAVRATPFYREARFLAAVPGRLGKSFDLPTRLARGVAAELRIPDCTGNFRQSAQRGRVKDLPGPGEKRAELEKAGLKMIAPGILPSAEEFVILLDDKYQSGETMRHTAAQMRAGGVACGILGLAVVKTLTNESDE